jgi:uncharacterized protein (DUF2342 family)
MRLKAADCGIALSAPTVEVEKRASIDQATAIVTDLYAQIQAYTGAISKHCSPSLYVNKESVHETNPYDTDATTAGISPASSIVDKAAAEAKVASSFTDITNAVIAATSKVVALPKRSLEARQTTPGNLATIVAMLLAEIFGALNNVIATLGLSKLLNDPP